MSDVMASPVYNPTINKNITGLYNLMDKSGDNEQLMSQFRTVVNNFSTVNPYEGVLTNPCKCDLEASRSFLMDTKASLNMRYDDVMAKGTPTPSYSPDPSQSALASEWGSSFPNVSNMLDDAIGGVSGMLDHTNRLVGNMPSIIGSIQNMIGSQVANGNNFGGSPCLPFADVFGSITGKGRAIIDQIMSSIQGVRNVASGLISQIQGAVSQLMGKISQAVDLVKNEVNKIAESMLSMTRMGLAQLISFLPDDPCMKSIIGNVMSSGASRILGI